MFILIWIILAMDYFINQSKQIIQKYCQSKIIKLSTDGKTISKQLRYSYRGLLIDFPPLIFTSCFLMLCLSIVFPLPVYLPQMINTDNMRQNLIVRFWLCDGLMYYNHNIFLNKNMSNLQTHNCVYELQLLHSASFLINQPYLLYTSFKNTPFSFAVTQHNNFLEPKLQEEFDSNSFETRTEMRIILQSSSNLNNPLNLKSGTEKILKKQTVPPRRTIQKESRNVASNLMRIFLKNVMELRSYDETIQKIIKQRQLTISNEAFYDWLLSFNINFKNYIRFTELRRLCSGTQRGEMHSIFRTLFKSYVKGIGVNHTLTSKRIERGSISMHLMGLRNLPLQLKIL